jgi:hypothetical protein
MRGPAHCRTSKRAFAQNNRGRTHPRTVRSVIYELRSGAVWRVLERAIQKMEPDSAIFAIAILLQRCPNV